MKILIADDDFITRELLRNSLETAGYEVVGVEDAEQALAVLEFEPIRMVITDWEMPGRSGPELCREIRSRCSLGYVYLILLTGHGTTAEIVEGMNAGADDFIVKPFNAAELLVRIRAGERTLSLETRELLIFSLAKLAESRDPETGKHLERVQQYVLLLAQHLATTARYQKVVTAEFIQLLYQTSPLHDIGKVGIPDNILLKPGRYTPDEFAIMKTHTLIGGRTLDAALARSPTASFLRFALDIAIAHHERYDGTGYPHGLTGDAIPLSARIVAVADVYDALTSKRTYKEAFPHPAARDIIVKDSGAHFDPAVVEAFLAKEEEIIRVGIRLQEIPQEGTGREPATPAVV